MGAAAVRATGSQRACPSRHPGISGRPRNPRPQLGATQSSCKVSWRKEFQSCGRGDWVCPPSHPHLGSLRGSFLRNPLVPSPRRHRGGGWRSAALSLAGDEQDCSPPHHPQPTGESETASPLGPGLHFSHHTRNSTIPARFLTVKASPWAENVNFSAVK